MRTKEPYLIWTEPDPSKPGAPKALGWGGLKRLLWWSAGIAAVLIAMPPIPMLLPIFWMLAVATGYGAAVLIAVLMVIPLRNLLLSPHGRISVPMHERLALWCLGLSVLHVAIFLIAEPMTIEYLKWSQPRYMIAGNVGFIVLVLLVVTSLGKIRPKLYGLKFRFRPWHVIGSIVLTVLTIAHMLGSAIYVDGRIKMLLFAILCAALPALVLRQPKPRNDTAPNQDGSP